MFWWDTKISQKLDARSKSECSRKHCVSYIFTKIVKYPIRANTTFIALISGSRCRLKNLVRYETVALECPCVPTTTRKSRGEWEQVDVVQNKKKQKKSRTRRNRRWWRRTKSRRWRRSSDSSRRSRKRRRRRWR